MAVRLGICSRIISCSGTKRPCVPYLVRSLMPRPALMKMSGYSPEASTRLRFSVRSAPSTDSISTWMLNISSQVFHARVSPRAYSPLSMANAVYSVGAASSAMAEATPMDMTAMTTASHKVSFLFMVHKPPVKTVQVTTLWFSDNRIIMKRFSYDSVIEYNENPPLRQRTVFCPS